MLEAVQVGIARFHGGVGLVVVGKFLVFDVDTLLGGFFLEHVVSFLGADHANGDLLVVTVTVVRGGTAGGEAEDERYNCQCSNKFFHGYETFCCSGLRCATTCTV